MSSLLWPDCSQVGVWIVKFNPSAGHLSRMIRRGGECRSASNRSGSSVCTAFAPIACSHTRPGDQGAWKPRTSSRRLFQWSGDVLPTFQKMPCRGTLASLGGLLPTPTEVRVDMLSCSSVYELSPVRIWNTGRRQALKSGRTPRHFRPRTVESDMDLPPSSGPRLVSSSLVANERSQPSPETLVDGRPGHYCDAWGRDADRNFV